MPNAQYSFVLVWKRVVAAMSLVAAALMAPTASAPLSGAGVTGSRAGSGPAIASTANALIAAVDGLVQGGERRSSLQEPESSGPQGKPVVLTAWHEFPTPCLGASPLATGFVEPPPAFAVRSGLTRAPPRA